MKFTVHTTEFIGHTSDLISLADLIQRKQVRLLTLTGPGGIGKTRIAREVLPSLADAYEDGIFWADLSDITDPDAVPQAICDAIQLSLPRGQSPDQALHTFLKHRETLIVLDNCEHVLQNTAVLCAGLLADCTALHFLATSREKLGIESEQTWPVQPLSYPDSDILTEGNAAQFEAIELFAARARQADPTFNISGQNLGALNRIHGLLEGLPLAIELAASWASVLTLQDMAGRMERHPGFLEKRSRGAAGRQRSLWETIRWSYDLLPEEEKHLFRSLSIFVGGFSAEAVEAVCTSGSGEEEPRLLLLGRLIDQSLIVRERSLAGESRFRMLETIRQFAAEQLAHSGVEDQLRLRHRAYFADLARRAEPHLVGPDQKRWTDLLETDHENLLVALQSMADDASLNPEHLQEAVDTANRLFWAWSYTERFHEGAAWYSRLRSQAGFRLETTAGADLVGHLGTFVWLMGDYETAKIHLKDSLGAARELDYQMCVGHAQLLLGLMAVHEMRLKEAIALLAECVQIFETLQEGRGLAIALTNLGAAYMEQQDFENADRHVSRAAGSARSRGDSWGLGLALMLKGDILARTGRPIQAMETIDTAIDLLGNSGQEWLRAEALFRKARIQILAEDYEAAFRTLEACIDTAQETGALEWQVQALEALFEIHLRQGNDSEAAAYFRQVIRLTGGDSYPQTVLSVLEGFVELASRTGNLDQAAILLSAVRNLSENARPASAEKFRQLEEMLERRLGKEAFTALVEKGRRLTLKSAADVAYEISLKGTQPAEPVEPEFDLRLLALGRAEVYLLQRQLVSADWTFAKPKELLFYLASNLPKTKEQIGLVFWPDASPAQLRASLRASLYHLRRALGDRDWILYENGTYGFNRDRNYWYDLEAFETGFDQAESLQASEGSAAIGMYETAVSLYRGDFLSDIASDEWALLRRENLRTRYLSALNSLGELYYLQGDYEMSLGAYRKLSGEDPLREDAHRGLMRVYEALGERASALQQFRLLRELLESELGVEPSPESQALYHSLK